jgi:hypothetical protein
VMSEGRISEAFLTLISIMSSLKRIGCKPGDRVQLQDYKASALTSNDIMVIDR